MSILHWIRNEVEQIANELENGGMTKAEAVRYLRCVGRKIDSIKPPKIRGLDMRERTGHPADDLKKWPGETVDNMQPISGDYFGELAGYAVVASLDGSIYVHPRIYHCEELAEQEAIRQRERFDVVVTDRIGTCVEHDGGFAIEAYFPTFEELGTVEVE